MSNPAFIVEGKHEQSIVKSLCGTKYPVRQLNLNGRDAPLNQIANRIQYIAKLFSNCNYPVIVILDREERTESVESMAKTIKELLSQNDDD